MYLKTKTECDPWNFKNVRKYKCSLTHTLTRTCPHALICTNTRSLAIKTRTHCTLNLAWSSFIYTHMYSCIHARIKITRIFKQTRMYVYTSVQVRAYNYTSIHTIRNSTNVNQENYMSVNKLMSKGMNTSTRTIVLVTNL